MSEVKHEKWNAGKVLIGVEDFKDFANEIYLGSGYRTVHHTESAAIADRAIMNMIASADDEA